MLEALSKEAIDSLGYFLAPSELFHTLAERGEAGKKAGEFYTPQTVSTILARIVTTGKQRLKSVYDPTCGSGSLLLRVAKEVEEVGDYYGQEMNRTRFNDELRMTNDE